MHLYLRHIWSIRIDLGHSFSLGNGEVKRQIISLQPLEIKWIMFMFPFCALANQDSVGVLELGKIFMSFTHAVHSLTRIVEQIIRMLVAV